MSSQVLVTGAAGFIGSHVCRHLLKAGHKVIGLVHAYSAHEKVQKHFGDLIKNVSLEEGVAKMSAWAKKAGACHGKPFEGIEIRKNLPPSWVALSKS